MSKFRVHGYAMVAVEVEMIVDAEDEHAAIRTAVKTFRKANRKRDYVVSGSADESSVEQWVPSLTERVG